jgi:hypothetical protein
MEARWLGLAIREQEDPIVQVAGYQSLVDL